jgi:hypothetical protein
MARGITSEDAEIEMVMNQLAKPLHNVKGIT